MPEPFLDGGHFRRPASQVEKGSGKTSRNSDAAAVAQEYFPFRQQRI
jgi:hypothetical protein